MTSVLLLSPIPAFAETYTVKSGDNLWDISERKNVNFQLLLEANSQISNKDLIYPDQVINLPDTSNEYTVLSGDTLWDISRKLDVNFLELLNINPQIPNKDLIFPGQKINIPKVTESKKNNLEVSVPENNTPEAIVLENTTPNVIAPENTTPDVIVPENTTPDIIAPENTTPDVIAPENTTPDVIAPENTTPDVIAPENTTPDVIVPENTTPDVTEPEGNDQAIVNQVVTLVNEERTKNGLQPLRSNVDLSEVAYIKAVDMANNNYFDHISPTYGNPFDMMRAFGITYSMAAENIAYGSSTAEAVMQGWMNSKDHRANILNPDFTEIGIGYENNERNWVQMFIQN